MFMKWLDDRSWGPWRGVVCFRTHLSPSFQQKKEPTNEMNGVCHVFCWSFNNCFRNMKFTFGIAFQFHSSIVMWTRNSLAFDLFHILEQTKEEKSLNMSSFLHWETQIQWAWFGLMNKSTQSYNINRIQISIISTRAITNALPWL